MIVLDKKNLIFDAIHFVQHGLREFLVHFLVMYPISRSKDRPRMSNVSKRPKALIGKTEIVSLLLFFGEPNTP